MLNQRYTYFPRGDGGLYLYEILTFDFDMWGEAAEVRKKNNSSIEEREEMLALERETRRLERIMRPRSLDNVEKSFRRAQKRAFELICANPDLDLFVTLTLKFDRDEYNTVIKRMSTWLDNAVRRKGLKYILVPEYHDDERAIHFHGVMNRSALKCAESGKYRGRKVIYNFPEWKHGFSTATAIDTEGEEWLAVSKKIRDYMMKDFYGRVGGRWYLHGGDLREPIYRYFQADYFTANGSEYNIKGTDYTYKLYRQR